MSKNKRILHNQPEFISKWSTKKNDWYKVPHVFNHREHLKTFSIAMYDERRNDKGYLSGNILPTEGNIHGRGGFDKLEVAGHGKLGETGTIRVSVER